MLKLIILNMPGGAKKVTKKKKPKKDKEEKKEGEVEETPDYLKPLPKHGWMLIKVSLIRVILAFKLFNLVLFITHLISCTLSSRSNLSPTGIRLPLKRR